jgi:hypothetical protein
MRTDHHCGRTHTFTRRIGQCGRTLRFIRRIGYDAQQVSFFGLYVKFISDFSDIYAVQQDRPVGYDSYGAHYDAPDSPDLYYIQQHPGPVASDVFNSNAETMYGGDGISLKVNADAPEENVDAAEATEVENSGAGSGTDDGL